MNRRQVTRCTETRTATKEEMFDGIVLILAGFKLTLPQTGGEGNVITVKALGAGCQIQSADGIEVGADGGSANVPSTVTTAITLRQNETLTLVRPGGTLGDKWLILDRACPTDAVAVGSLESVAVGTGDGTTVNFDLPTDEIYQLLVWVNGSLKAPTDYSISAGAGTAGVDRLVFAVAPTNTHPILAFYTRKTRL